MKRFAFRGGGLFFSVLLTLSMLIGSLPQDVSAHNSSPSQTSPITNSDVTPAPVSPVIITGNATVDPTNNSFGLKGTLLTLGSFNMVMVSFDYGKTTNYGSSTNIVTLTLPGPFRINLLNYEPNTTY